MWGGGAPPHPPPPAVRWWHGLTWNSFFSSSFFVLVASVIPQLTPPIHPTPPHPLPRVELEGVCSCVWWGGVCESLRMMRVAWPAYPSPPSLPRPLHPRDFFRSDHITPRSAQPSPPFSSSPAVCCRRAGLLFKCVCECVYVCVYLCLCVSVCVNGCPLLAGCGGRTRRQASHGARRE